MARRTGMFAGLAVAGFLLAGVAAWGAVWMNTRVPRAGTMARVLVPKGSTLASVTDSLESARVVLSGPVTRLIARVTGRGSATIQPGRYLVRRGASVANVIDQLVAGRGRFHRITIPEGWGIQQIVRLAHDSLGIDTDSLLAATRDSSRRARMATPAADLEGYLFPATYDFTEDATAGNVVDSMLVAFEKRWKAEWDAEIAKQGRTRHAVVTLASIVEKEAVHADERGRIAAVYLNRLAKGMRLQADPTVLYAMGLVAKRVLYADLQFASPYNTYRNAGLPPGPIASPGTASLAAAVQPDSSDAMFFVAFPDGHSRFTRTFDEHTAAVKASRAARDSAAKVAAARATAAANPATAPR